MSSPLEADGGVSPVSVASPVLESSGVLRVSGAGVSVASVEEPGDEVSSGGVGGAGGVLGGVGGVTPLGGTGLGVVADGGVGGVGGVTLTGVVGVDGVVGVTGVTAGSVVVGCAELLELVDPEPQAATTKNKTEGVVTRRMKSPFEGVCRF